MSYLVLGLVAGLAAVERKGFLQAMLSRPIALGPLTGLALGDVAGGLYVAAPLELLWLGAVNLGAALPVHEALGTAAITGGTVLASRALRTEGLDGPALLPAVAVLAVFVCAPLALLGRRADRLVEHWNEWLHARAERELAAGEASAAARVNLYGLALPFGIGFVLAPLGAAVVVAVVPFVLLCAPGTLPALALGWVAFAAFACASGAKAMRAPRAGALYFGAMGLGLCLFLATALAGGGT
ncbi:MAG: PTS sorbose transporter subunit IIC [Anaeromyxobacter sp. RBG_16_69_14]|nr:MAG: PTS sorbose transporter subunit IIC [Anaeromyxobacter sp. RBG_16_69_14]